MATEAEKDFAEWQRQLATKAGEPVKDEWVYPFMACPNEQQRLDPLQGCSDCKGVGYHHSIPNPDWDNPNKVRARWNATNRWLDT